MKYASRKSRSPKERKFHAKYIKEDRSQRWLLDSDETKRQNISQRFTIAIITTIIILAVAAVTTTYRQVSDIRRTLVGNWINNSDVVGASPVGAAPTASSFFTWHLASMYWAKTTASRDENKKLSGVWCVLY